MSATLGEGGFPPGFLWGAATSAYQIEGAVHEGGRGPSIWDTFSHTPGRVAGGDTGDVAADHYHRWREDAALMEDLGLGAYRFSIAWPRVQPEGRGRPSPAGLDFYQRLVDGLLERGIQPVVTLYHWDLPQALQDAGGWPARETAARFVDYAEAVFAALSDRVRWWTTLNEPWVAAFLGYGSGEHAPGVRDHQAAVQAAHHLLLAHGQAVRALRAIDPSVSFAVTVDPYPVSAASPAAADQDAARRIDGLRNRIILDPLLLGRYPDDVLDDLGRVVGLEHLRPGDAELIGAPVDVLGVNYYRRLVVAAGPGDRGGPGPWPGAADVVFRRCRWRSPSSARPSTTRSTRRATCTTPPGPASSTTTSAPPGRPSRPASTCAGCSSGRCWTTSSGRRATRSASAWSTSTTRPGGGPSRTAPTGTAT
jgi:beta-glucosidase